MELIQMTEYIEFHVDSFYETSRFFIFGFAPSYSSNNKGNWQLRAERKKKKKPNNLFQFVWDYIQGCRNHSELYFRVFEVLSSFEITLRWKNKIVKYVVTSCYVKDFLHAEQ